MTITVTNAANGSSAEIYTHKIFGYTWSTALQCTVLISTEGAQFPVKETKEEIKEKIKAQKITKA